MEETKDFIKDDFRLFELFTEVAHFRSFIAREG